MQRRKLLSSLGAATAAGLAGCLGGSSDEETPSETPSPEPTDTATPTPTETPSPYLYNVKFDTEVGCDVEPVEDAVVFDEEEKTVTVSGSFSVSDPCYEPKLTRALNQDGTLGITVETKWKTPSEGSCESCDAVATYEVTALFAEGIPEAAEVTTVNGDQRSSETYQRDD